MSPKDPLNKNLNDKANIPGVPSGLVSSGRKGKVNTKWANIRWNRKKLVFAFLALGVPYISVIVASIVTGLYLATAIFVALAILVGVLVLAVRFIDNQDKF